MVVFHLGKNRWWTWTKSSECYHKEPEFVHLSLLSLIYSFASCLANSTMLVLYFFVSRRTSPQVVVSTYQVPTCSKPTSTTSPSLSQTCGFRPIPTPAGLFTCQIKPSEDIEDKHKTTHVPVKMTSPGIKVTPRLSNETVCFTPKIKFAVDPFW